MTKEAVLAYLDGEDIHIHPDIALRNCPWDIVGQQVGKAPHSIFDILNHTIFWQNLFIKRIDGQEMKSPEKPSTGWPQMEAPVSTEAWEKAIRRFEKGLACARDLARHQDLEKVISTFRGMSIGEISPF